MIVGNRSRVGLSRKPSAGVVKANKDFRFGHRGPQHPYGLCICCDDLQVIFVHIPKNGSSSIRSLFSIYKPTSQKVKQYRGREVNYFDLPEDIRSSYYTFCVLRDVRDRFHSAVNTILSRDQTDISSLSAGNLCRMVDNMVDTHLVRQISFVKGIKIDYYLPFVRLRDIPVHENASKSDVKETKRIRDIPNRIIDSVYASDIKLLRKHAYDARRHDTFLRRLRLK